MTATSSTGLDLTNIGKQLRHARKRAGLTQKSAAKRTGYSPRTIHRYENGKGDRLTIINDLCAAYRTHIIDILLAGGTDSTSIILAGLLPPETRPLVIKVARAIEILEGAQ